jgi:hypothetical protein
MYNYVKVGDNVTTFMQNNFLQYVNSYILANTVQLDSDFDSDYDTTKYLVIFFCWEVKNWGLESRSVFDHGLVFFTSVGAVLFAVDYSPAVRGGDYRRVQLYQTRASEENPKEL